ncbi:uncharacterized protein LOC134667784 [Cydia fagiglandana]|uniref:uncharacterized protein LOC134667784 n=1 Tax=Cydia fagiglandana TaxID=1458189 RepID=UPI002FEE475B
MTASARTASTSAGPAQRAAPALAAAGGAAGSARGHESKDCKSRHACRVCTQRHHSSLHEDAPHPNVLLTTESSSSPELRSVAETSTPTPLHGATGQPSSKNCTVLLTTALVNLRPLNQGPYTPRSVRTLVDQGSQTTLISESCVQRLGLPRYAAQPGTTLTGIGGEVQPRGYVLCEVTPHNKPEPKLHIEAYIIPDLTSYIAYIPKSIGNIQKFQHLQKLDLADPELRSTRPVELLLGSDYLDSILLLNNIKGPPGTPVAINSIFGYLIGGRISYESMKRLSVNLSTCQLDMKLQKFWELESIPEHPHLTKDELRCESIFVDTHTRDANGKYTVSLPFKENAPPLGDSRTIALSRLTKLEARLSRDPALRENYNKCIQEYLDLGHMEPVTDSASPGTPPYYLPHHVVVKSSTSTTVTTKYHIVYDASYSDHGTTDSDPSPATTAIHVQHAIITIAKSGSGWDAAPPQGICDLWFRFIDELPLLQDIVLLRHVLPSTHQVSLHGFSDASEKAYAACVYIRVVDSNGAIITHLLIGKTKVALLKRLTIPRLELCGAHLLSKLIKKVLTAYSSRLSFDQVYAWSDSTITLAWLRSSPDNWRTYVSNRIAETTSNVPASQWHHVQSADNPADPASRGVLPSQLNHQLWFTGPSWLSQNESEWPKTNVVCHTDEERRKHVLLTQTNEPKCLEFIERFSSLPRMLRVISYMLRFINKCRKTNSPTTKHVTVPETKQALSRIISLVQSECFSEDISRLKDDDRCTKRLQKLKPFLDDAGLLRVGGRINRANVPLPSHRPTGSCVLAMLCVCVHDAAYRVFVHDLSHHSHQWLSYLLLGFDHFVPS